VRRKISTLCLIVVFCFGSNGCVSMSAQARRERAYRHYVQHQIKQRQKEVARAQKAANRQLKQKLKNLRPSDPQMATRVEDVSTPSFSEPIAAPSEAAASSPDTVVAPVTVSASDAIATQTPDQPSRP
jgi:regulator of protease activity HflC (stomatin/prohibitin superfamily)